MLDLGPCHESAKSSKGFTFDPGHYMKFARRQTWRIIGSVFDPMNPKYDSEFHGPRWYRFPWGGKLPDRRFEDKSCGTQYHAWIKEKGHPEPKDGIVDRTVCFGAHCYQEAQIKVAACNISFESFYIYELIKTMDNDSGYCFESNSVK